MAEDILGKMIVGASQVYESGGPPEGLDFSQTYLELETGRVLAIPSSMADEVEEAVVPAGAERVVKSLEGKLVGRRIVQVYRRMLDEEERDGDSVILVLDDGSHVTELFAVPRGVGAGPRVYGKEEAVDFLLKDVEVFWKVDG